LLTTTAAAFVLHGADRFKHERAKRVSFSLYNQLLGGSTVTTFTTTTTQMNSYHANSYEDIQDPDAFSLSGYQRPKVNWYPGHIAKAERQLSETLKSVDVVIEVRDARAPKATAHPSVGKWTAGRPRVVVMTRMDCVTSATRESVWIVLPRQLVKVGEEPMRNWVRIDGRNSWVVMKRIGMYK